MSSPHHRSEVIPRAYVIAGWPASIQGIHCDRAQSTCEERPLHPRRPLAPVRAACVSLSSLRSKLPDFSSSGRHQLGRINGNCGEITPLGFCTCNMTCWPAPMLFPPSYPTGAISGSENRRSSFERFRQPVLPLRFRSFFLTRAGSRRQSRHSSSSVLLSPERSLNDRHGSKNAISRVSRLPDPTTRSQSASSLTSYVSSAGSTADQSPSGCLTTIFTISQLESYSASATSGN
jgi:hypothetical protein